MKASRTEFCACGGAILAVIGDEGDAVLTHNMTEQHRLWSGEPSPDVCVPVRISTVMMSAATRLLGPVACHDCGELVNVVRYGCCIYNVHLDGSLACSAEIRQHPETVEMR